MDNTDNNYIQAVSVLIYRTLINKPDDTIKVLRMA